MPQTYQGVIEHGNIRLMPDVNLPEGTCVYVTVIPTLDERYARRKAAAWLAAQVGDQLMPGSATLIRQEHHLVWSFPVMIGSPFEEPLGPIGYVEVDAETGTILTTSKLAKEFLQNAEHLANSAFPLK